MKLILTILITISLSFASEVTPFKTKNSYVMDYNKTTKCLVRNLDVYKNPKWAVKIELKNGKKIFFSSPKSMFEFYFRPGRWFDIGVRSEDDFKDIIVTDYQTMKLIDAKKAFYIYGSRAISPAGDDLVVIEDENRAKEFAKKYNGKRVFRFKQVSDALIRLINGRI